MKTVVDAQSIVLNRSGVGRYTFNLLKAFACLKKEEHKIIPFFFNFRRKFNEQDVWKRNPGNMVEPCEIRLIPGFILHQLWMRLPLFPLDLFTSNADVFHFPNYLMKPVSKGKIILTVHDMAFLRYPETLMKKNLRMLKQGFNKSLEKSDAIITVSEFSKNEFHYFYPLYKKPVYVTHNGIDEFLNLKFDSDLNEKICLKYKLPKKYLLHVGTIEPRKNLGLLLKVLKLLKEKKEDIKLVLVGPVGWSSDEFFKEMKQLDLYGDIIFPGFVSSEELPYLYKNALIFLFPSVYEGFGIPPLEAMACSVPVIASDIPVMHEVLGDASVFCDPHSPDHWLEWILKIISDKDLNDKLRIKGIEQIKKFLWSDTALKTLEIYEDVS